MGFYAIMILTAEDEPHPRYEFVTSADNDKEATKKALMYIEAWEMQDVKITNCRLLSKEEKEERLNDKLHYLAEGYKKYQNEEKQMG